MPKRDPGISLDVGGRGDLDHAIAFWRTGPRGEWTLFDDWYQRELGCVRAVGSSQWEAVAFGRSYNRVRYAPTVEGAKAELLLMIRHCPLDAIAVPEFDAMLRSFNVDPTDMRGYTTPTVNYGVYRTLDGLSEFANDLTSLSRHKSSTNEALACAERELPILRERAHPAEFRLITLTTWTHHLVAGERHGLGGFNSPEVRTGAATAVWLMLNRGPRAL